MPFRALYSVLKDRKALKSSVLKALVRLFLKVPHMPQDASWLFMGSPRGRAKAPNPQRAGPYKALKGFLSPLRAS